MELKGQYTDVDAEVKPGQRGVHDAMGHIEKSISELAKCVAELRERLGPVLRSDAEDVALAMEEPSGACAIAMHLIAYESEIQRIARQVIDLNARLAL